MPQPRWSRRRRGGSQRGGTSSPPPWWPCTPRAGTHLTALIWLGDQMLDEGDELLRLGQLAAAAAKVGARHLFAPGDGGSATVWFTAPPAVRQLQGSRCADLGPPTG